MTETVLASWAKSAKQRPHAIAYRDDDCSLSHAELLEKVTSKASLLVARGLRPGHRVAILVGSDAERVTWMVAVMLAGGCVVSLGLNQPGKRLRDLLRRLAPVLVVTDPGTRSLVEGVPVLDVKHPAPLTASDGPLPRIAGGWPAYLCFTSGTSGQPKGVIVPHSALAQTTGALVAHLGLEESPRTHVLATSWSFDVAMLDLWLALTTAGTLVAPHRDDLFGTALARTLMGAVNPMIQAVPSLFGTLSDADLALLPRDSILVLGGESAPPELLRRLSNCSDVHLAYGITETAVCSTMHHVTAETPTATLGVPLPGVDCQVVDRNNMPVPVGAIGELLIGGTSLSHGYLNDPAHTARVFVPAPGGRRYYRSGDLVRQDQSGVLTFCGRVDDQVKIRGHRVEPAETEHALLALPGVRQAAVIARKDPSGQSALVAYVSGSGLVAAEIRQMLAGRIPDWMVPSVVVVLQEFPVNATGKIARTQLPEPDWHIKPVSQETSSSGAEQTMAALWKSLLGVDVVRSKDSFVALGGHSLKAAQLTATLRTDFGVTVRPSEILAASSLEDLSRMVEAAPSAVDDNRRELTQTGEASPAQRHIWLHQQLVGTDGVYNIVVTVELQGPLNVLVLQRALHLTEQECSALRQRLFFDGEKIGIVERPADLRPLRVRSAGARLAESVRSAGTTAIDIAEGAPWRYELFTEEGADHHTLLLTFHHAAVDGVAVQLILKHLGRVYSSLANGGIPDPFPPKSPGAEALSAVDSDPTFWTTMQETAPEPVRLPGQQVAVDSTDFKGWSQPVALSGVERAAIVDIATANGTSSHTVVLSCVLRALALLTSRTELVIGLPMSARGSSAGAADIGHFVTVLPVLFELPADLAPKSTLEAVAQRMREVHDHTSNDPGLVLDLLLNRRNAAFHSLFHIVFAWEDERADIEFEDLRADWNTQFNGWSDVDLTLQLKSSGPLINGRISGRNATNDSIDVSATVQVLSDCFTDLISTRMRNNESKGDSV